MTEPNTTRILRLPDVMQRLRISRSLIYAKIQAGEFPKPVWLGGNSRGWLESEIEAWLADRVARRDAGGAASCK